MEGTQMTTQTKKKMSEEWEALARAHSEVRVFIEFAHANPGRFQTFLMHSLSEALEAKA